MGCGCGGKKPARPRSRQITKPIKKQLAPSNETLSALSTSGSDSTLDKDRREIERKRREAILKKLGRI